MKFFVVFLIFAQNIDCGYTLEDWKVWALFEGEFKRVAYGYCNMQNHGMPTGPPLKLVTFHLRIVIFKAVKWQYVASIGVFTHKKTSHLKIA